MIDILRVVLALPETIDQLRKEMNRMQVDLTKLRADVDTLKTETAAALTRVAEDVQAWDLRSPVGVRVSGPRETSRRAHPRGSRHRLGPFVGPAKGRTRSVDWSRSWD